MSDAIALLIFFGAFLSLSALTWGFERLLRGNKDE